MTGEDTGFFATVPAERPRQPPLPAPGPGFRLLLALSVLSLRANGAEETEVEAYKKAALTQSPTTTIPPEH